MTADSAAVIIDTSHAIKDAEELETQIIDRGGSSRAAAALLARMKMQQENENESDDSMFGDNEDEKPQVIGELVESEEKRSEDDKDEQRLDLAAKPAENILDSESEGDVAEDEGLMRPIFLGKRDREVLNTDNSKTHDHHNQELDKLEENLDNLKHQQIQDLVKLSIK